ncbi:MAG: cell division protein FtsZ [Muribaculaceae bacterium]|nr:cell division protein FtsZ [Muribaculaceae bacterium]
MDQYNNTSNQPIDDASAFAPQTNDLPDPIIIKAVGVGGGGNNAVNHMYRQGIQKVSFVNINSDNQALRNSDVPCKLSIGNGLGAGNKPEIARAYAEEAVDEINALFDDDTKMVFITAGMGGGTGTGAAPVVARVAKQRGLLTIGIVTIPFLFEGQVKIKKAIAGADEMAQYVDALLVVNNERLTEIYGDLTFRNAFAKADDTLSIAARSISDIINCDGLINLDFNDVDTTLRDGGAAIISTGYGEGPGRVTAAIQDALNSPLLKNRDILGSKKLLFNLYFNPEGDDFLMSETDELRSFINSINNDVDIIYGVSFDESLGNSVKITILAAGFDVTLSGEEEDIEKSKGGGNAPFIFGGARRQQPQQPGTTSDIQAHSHHQTTTATTPQAAAANQPAANQPATVTEERIEQEYGPGKLQDRTSTIILGLNQMDDDQICETLENYPAYKRDRKIVESVRNGAYDTGTRPSSTSTPTGHTFCY